MGTITFLTKEDIVDIHTKLTIDALKSDDPISPPGIKSEDLLESAISRQETGFGGALKYNSPILNAASLCYGICCNHPLHNGNKRTALLSLMCHLDRNGITFSDKANRANLYSFMIKIANHSLIAKKKLKASHDNSDLEIQEMGKWIGKKTRKIQKADRTVSYAEFERILRSHDIYFENKKNNYTDLIKYTTKRETKWFSSREVKVPTKIARIPYFPSRMVGKKLIRSVRKQAGLTHKSGVDSESFYGNQTQPDAFIQQYKKLLSKLAKT